MSHTLVIPFDRILITTLTNKTIVIKTSEFTMLKPMYHEAEKNNTLHAIWLESDMPFTSIPFDEGHINMPLAVFPAGFGSFKELINKLDLLKKLNLRVYLSSDNEKTFTALNILSSLGIHTALVFGDRPIDWDKTNDLMHYSVYSRASHAPIEPFNYVIANYGKQRFTCYSAVYFNNPSMYLHVNKNQEIAFTAEELNSGNYFSKGLEILNSLKGSEVYNERMNSWQELFLQEHGCAYCPSWRVCVGKFAQRREDKPGCIDFFSDLIDACCLNASKTQNDKVTIWQP